MLRVKICICVIMHGLEIEQETLIKRFTIGQKTRENKIEAACDFNLFR